MDKQDVDSCKKGLPQWAINGKPMPPETEDALLDFLYCLREKSGLPETSYASLVSFSDGVALSCWSSPVSAILLFTEDYCYNEFERRLYRSISNDLKKSKQEDAVKELEAIRDGALAAMAALEAAKMTAPKLLEAAMNKRFAGLLKNLPPREDGGRRYWFQGITSYNHGHIDALHTILWNVVDVIDPSKTRSDGKKADGIIPQKGRDSECKNSFLNDLILHIRYHIGRVPTQSELSQLLEILLGKEGRRIAVKQAISRAYNEVLPSEIIAYFESKQIKYEAIAKKEARLAAIDEAYNEIYVIRPGRQNVAVPPLSEDKREELYSLFWVD